jgi:hypothetical protein
MWKKEQERMVGISEVKKKITAPQHNPIPGRDASAAAAATRPCFRLPQLCAKGKNCR